jgi:hypothetical protein
MHIVPHLPHPDTVHPIFLRHVHIARKVGVTRYKLAYTRPPRQIIAPILPQQGRVFNMIWSWALTTVAAETIEQQLQYNTQYFPQELLLWLQGWLLRSWLTTEDISSPASAFAVDNIPTPPSCPVPPPPVAPPPMFTGGMASERQDHLLETWLADHKHERAYAYLDNIPPLPMDHVELFALGRIL